VTLAVNACVTPPVERIDVPGVTDTVGDAAAVDVNVIVAFADLVASSTAVAVSVTVGGFGTVAGAVYTTAAPDAAVAPESVPQAVPVQPGPESAHDVPLLFGSFATVAVKFIAWLTCTDADPGFNITKTLVGCGAGFFEDPPPHPEKNPATAVRYTVATAKLIRATPRGKRINPPEKRPGTGAAL